MQWVDAKHYNTFVQLPERLPFPNGTQLGIMDGDVAGYIYPVFVGKEGKTLRWFWCHSRTQARPAYEEELKMTMEDAKLHIEQLK